MIARDSNAADWLIGVEIRVGVRGKGCDVAYWHGEEFGIFVGG